MRLTRQWPQFHMGASPRAGIALMQGARTLAAFCGRDYAVPDDVVQIALPALRHRVILTAEAEVEGQQVDELLTRTDSHAWRCRGCERPLADVLADCWRRHRAAAGGCWRTGSRDLSRTGRWCCLALVPGAVLSIGLLVSAGDVLAVAGRLDAAIAAAWRWSIC